jgi:hypothetical protein
MSAPAPPRAQLAHLDRLIVAALAELRAARRVASRTGDPRGGELESRAERHLNVLLDYRHAAQHR